MHNNNKAWFMNDRYLKSFWDYHQATLQWFRAHQAARESLMTNSSNTVSNSVDIKSKGGKRRFVKSNRLSSTARTSSNDSSSDVRQQSSSADVDGDIVMSSEMADFFRQTIEHRKQRDADRNKEAKKNKDGHLEYCGEDDYVMADKIGVYNNEKRTFQLPNNPAERQMKFNEMKKLYGSDAEKILAMEAHLDLRFDQNYLQPGAHLWPNIPLKL
ncbi:Gemini of Cajal bodies-associated protein 8 family protein [Acanthocheilonema viteae]|uniref:Uncharacterized protein n=1 Tax=Acanthocheilonema viteae TaxID=6277 RepID=A0A498S582_ACAVI|nr:unnamed protein product [Acanthocheilonema viteae]